MKKYIFPIILISLDIGAGFVYLASGDIKKVYLLDCRGGFKYYCYVLMEILGLLVFRG